VSVWTKRIEFRSRIGHVVVASVVGCIVQLVEIAVFERATGGTISYTASGWMIIPAMAVTYVAVFLPMHVAMFVSWRLRPVEGRRTEWQYGALIIAATIGGVGQFLLFVIGENRLSADGFLSFPLWFCTWLASVPLALWVLRLLRPHGPGPVLRRKRRGRLHAGDCLNCGYDLTHNEPGVCPECGETIWQSPSHP